MVRKTTIIVFGLILLVAMALLAGTDRQPTVEELRALRVHSAAEAPDIGDWQPPTSADQVSPAAIFIVNTTADVGAGSLRDAINQANTNLGHDIINFNIAPPGGVHTIAPLSPLPWLLDPSGVTIDGTTQPGAAVGASPPSSLILKIELDGTNITAGGGWAFGNMRGLVAQSDNDTIQGLIVNNWWESGICIQGGPINQYARHCLVQWNIVGMDSTGTVCKGNGVGQQALWAGICICNSPKDEMTPAYAFMNTIQENLSSCNYTEGITVVGPVQPGDVHSNHVLRNYTGTDINGTADRGNVHEGICLCEGTHDNRVRRNLSSGNDYDGIGLQGYNNEPFAAPPILTHANQIDSNIVGLDVYGNPLSNTMAGITIGEYGPSQWGCADNNIIMYNTIAENGWDGVAVWEDPINSFNADHNQITQNSIFDNDSLGIDLQNDYVTPNDGPADPDSLANQEMNFPVITSVTYSVGNTTINGTLSTPLPNTGIVEVFQARLDLSGYGEGERYLGSTVPDAAGNWSLTDATLVPGDSVTATATDSFFNTSEFCATVPVGGGGTDPDTCEYYKPAYVDYAPAGMPDFDQKQYNWFCPSTTAWSHCGPVALANCFWWFDSKFETSGTPPPAYADNYPLVQNYVAGADDHDSTNVQPFVDSLALYCQTNAGTSCGTSVFDLAKGAQDWLDSVGLGSKYNIQVVPMDMAYGFEYLRKQVLDCQDVILLIGFWQEQTPGYCERRGGHFMTIAGVCTDPSDSALCFSDPYYDLNEGDPPGPPVHNAGVHNDAQFVSGPHGTMHHDKYYVDSSTCQATGQPFFLELRNYASNPGWVANFDGQNRFDTLIDPTPPNANPVHALLEFAVVICPVVEPKLGKVKHNTDGYEPGDGSPIGTNWHELWPNYCENWVCSSWVDNGDGILSYCDTIDFVHIPTGRKIWEHVEVVTPTITVTDVSDPTNTTYLDLIDPNPMCTLLTSPVGTYWHEVHPNYCTVWQITNWTDNGNGYLDYCDWIDIETSGGGATAYVHVEAFETDIITTPLPIPDADEYDHNLDGYHPSMGDPSGTQWHELWPNYCEMWDLTEWRDNGDGVLSYCDTIKFEYPGDPDSVIWKHIEEVTPTIKVTNELDTLYLDFMCGNPMVEDIDDPIYTFWHEVYPNFCVRRMCIGWTDNGSGILDSCDYIQLELLDGPDSGTVMEYHVEAWETDIVTTILDIEEPPVPTPGKVKHNLDGYKPTDGSPIGSDWHELWPNYCVNWACSSWHDNGDGILSYCDTIDFVDMATGRKIWEHVELVTPTIEVTDTIVSTNIMFLDQLDPNPLCTTLTDPVGTWWHEVYPGYCTVWRLTAWTDNGNGYLDYCDFIDFELPDGSGYWAAHVEAFETDIVTTPLPIPDADEYDHNLDGYRPADGDPTGTRWHELWPTFCRMWNLVEWRDNGDGYLSFCDTIKFANPSVHDTVIWKHVEDVMPTIKLWDGSDTSYFDHMCGNTMVVDITNPINTYWHEIVPNFCQRSICVGWADNGNGFLDSCDYIDLMKIDGADSGTVRNYHVEAFETDIVTTIIPDPTPPSDSLIMLDTVYNINPAGELPAGPLLKFMMRWKYTVGSAVTAFANGFRVYSPDGATWQPIVIDTVSRGWPSRFDLNFGFTYNSANGSGADTAGVAGVSMLGSGIPSPFDSLVWWIETRVSIVDTGKTLCIDSSFFRTSGVWTWATSPTPGGFPPAWTGPHCYKIVACCNHDGLRGDADYSMTLDVGDLTYLVAYLFQSGPTPPCYEEGDVDGSGFIDVGDLTYLVAYLFQGGSTPAACPP
ncbi:MAG: hypothetical protein ABII79_04090 [bacterium]